MFNLFNRYDQTPGGVNVAATEVKQRLDRGDKITLLDVREQWEYDTARINGAKLIPMRELETRKAELNANDEIVVYCHMGVRSLKAIHYLQQHGFTNLKNLSGGIEAWSTTADPSVPHYR
jgi:adenylyltransferase/sulfurtransferase